MVFVVSGHVIDWQCVKLRGILGRVASAGVPWSGRVCGVCGKKNFRDRKTCRDYGEYATGLEQVIIGKEDVAPQARGRSSSSQQPSEPQQRRKEPQLPPQKGAEPHFPAKGGIAACSSLKDGYTVGDVTCVTRRLQQ